MPANLENSAVATGLEKVSFHSSSKERKCLIAKSCPILCDPMECNFPGLPVSHYPPEFSQVHIHWIGDAIQPSHSLSSPSPPAPNLSQHQSLFQWVNSSREVAKILEFQYRSLVPLPFLKPAWTSGSSRFTYCWSLAWKILSITLPVCEMSAIVR